MRSLLQGISALLLGAASGLGSEVVFTTVTINTAICTTTAHGGNNTNGNGNGGNSTNLITVQSVDTPYGIYTFEGFYPLSDPDGTSFKVVEGTETTDTMDPRVCGSFCQGAEYFEIQNGNQCSCSCDPPEGTAAGSADPKTPCSGNKTEVCGSPGYGIVYRGGNGGASSSSAQVFTPTTIIVTGTVTDTAGTHTFTSTDVISTVTTETGGTETSSVSFSTSYYMGLSTPSTNTLSSSSGSNGTGSLGTPTITTVGPESSPSQTYTTNGSICFGLSCIPESVTGRTGEDSSTAGPLSSNASSVASTSGDVTPSTSASSSASTTGALSSNATSVSPTSSGNFSSISASSSAPTSNATSVSPTSSGNSSSISITTSASTSASTTSNPTYPCPAYNNQEYTDSNSVSYDIACNTNYLGNDLESTDARTFGACLADCDSYAPNPNVQGGASCVAVTFGIGGTNSCYLKSAVTTVDSPNPGYDSAKLASYNPQSLSSTSTSVLATTSSSLATVSSSTTNVSSSSTVVGSSSSTAAIDTSSSTETVASSTPSSSESSSKSASSTSSVSSSISVSSSSSSISTSTVPSSSSVSSSSSKSSSSSLSSSSSVSSSSSKTSSSSISSSSSVSSSSSKTSSSSKSSSSSASSSSSPASTSTHASSSSSSSASSSTTPASSTVKSATSTYSFPDEPTSITTPVCGAAVNTNNTIYDDIFGYPYYVKCGRDIIGDNAYPAHADTFAKCLEYCDLLVGCAAVTYLDGAAQTDANCFPYSSFIGYSSGPNGVYSGVPKNGTSDGAIQATPNLCAPDPNGYNQSVYSDYFGNDYFIGCDQNVAGAGPPGGQDLKATVTDTLLGCLTYCSIYNGCVGVDFTGFPVQQNAANCYPKFSTGAITYQAGTQLAYLYD